MKKILTIHNLGRMHKKAINYSLGSKHSLGLLLLLSGLLAPVDHDSHSPAEQHLTLLEMFCVIKEMFKQYCSLYPTELGLQKGFCVFYKGR